jgi:hypothetical protein
MWGHFYTVTTQNIWVLVPSVHSVSSETHVAPHTEVGTGNAVVSKTGKGSLSRGASCPGMEKQPVIESLKMYSVLGD